MNRRVRGHRNAPATLDQLRAALLEEWENIPMRRINALMNSMHRRIRAVTDAQWNCNWPEDFIPISYAC
jgi:hypothetical protein